MRNTFSHDRRGQSARALASFILIITIIILDYSCTLDMTVVTWRLHANPRAGGRLVALRRHLAERGDFEHFAADP